MVTANNNEASKHVVNFRQSQELSRHVLFVDFPSACAWKWKG